MLKKLLKKLDFTLIKKIYNYNPTIFILGLICLVVAGLAVGMNYGEAIEAGETNVTLEVEVVNDVDTLEVLVLNETETNTTEDTTEQPNNLNNTNTTQ